MLEGFSQRVAHPGAAAAGSLFTLGDARGLPRSASLIPTPGIDGAGARRSSSTQAANNVFGLFNLFSGGALERFSIFALGIMPYISARIILQLLTVVVPYLEQLSKEGEPGRRKINQYTRYGTIVLSHRPELLHRDRPRADPGAGRRVGRLSTRAGASGS